MSFNPHVPLVSARPAADSEVEDTMGRQSLRNTNADHHKVERTRKLSCWHILSVSVGVFALVVSAVILVANVTYYLNEDHMLERCTSEDAESFMPCHYLKMILAVASPKVATAEALRFYLHIAYLAGIVFVTHYILATMVLMLGVATNKHCALVPWFVSQFVLALCLSAGMMLEMYTDHLAMAEAGKGHGGPHVVALKSKYFVMTTAALAFVVMNWVVNSVTFSRIRKLNSEINQTFDYARFDRRN